VTAVTGKGQQFTLSSQSALPGEALEIIAIRLSGTGVRDAELVHLTKAPRLRELSLAGATISDRGLAHVATLQQLTQLDLTQTEVTNAGLAHVARLTQLIDLNLQKTKVTDPGLTRLAGLSNLQRLVLSDTAVGDVGIEQLGALPALEFVALHGTGLSEAGHQALLGARPGIKIAWDGADVERVAALRLLDLGATLKVSDLAGRAHENIRSREALPPGRIAVKQVDASTAAQFGDDDLAQLALLPQIESLNLTGAAITPEGLAQLHGLTSLKSLELGPIRLPAAPLEALRKALVDCKVTVKEPPDAEVARLVLAAKGRITLATLQGALIADLVETAKLPAEGFVVRGVNVEGIAAIDDALVGQLCDLPDLESLFLTGTPITDDSASQLAACRSLRELSLSDTQVTAAGVGALARLPALERLYLANTKIGREGARRAADCPRLTHLSLQGVELADDDVALLKRLEKLEWLELSGTPLSDAAAVHLKQLGALKQLNITRTAVSDAGLEELQTALASCRVTGDPPDPQRLAARWIAQSKGTVTLDSGPLMRIEDLPRGDCHVLAIDLAELAKLSPAEIAGQIAVCPEVVSLNLSDTKLRTADLACLDKLLALRDLRLANLPVTDASLARLAGKEKLEVLDLTGSQVTGAGLAALAKSTDLKQLILASAPVDERHFPALATFPKLEVLSVAASRSVGDAGLAHIEKLSALKSLDLRGTKVSDAGLARLAALSGLEQLDLEGTTVTSAGVAKLASLTKLRRINLGRTGVADDCLATLTQLKQLKSINLARTKVSPEGIRQLQTALPGCAIVAPTPPPRDPMGASPQLP
jgi:Leucine-rich repeat (LRR) protein